MGGKENSDQPRRSGAGGRRGRRRGEDRGGLRFAFYGRMSTKEFQDQETSLAWQLEVAEETIADGGLIVAEYFDEGCSRRWSWSKRPRAAALLAAVQSPDRGFDAVVVGEYERAFYGDQVQAVMAYLADHGIGLWLPEAGGPVDLEDSAHQALMLLLGSQSRREVLKARHRVLAAMRAQVCTQGRFLGGRPPYGYRLVDAGPHPNSVHAGWGVDSTGWSRIRRRPRGCGGCLLSVPRGAVLPASRGVDNRAGYRCRHGYTSARDQPTPSMKNTYVREDHLLDGLRARLSEITSNDDAAVADYVRTNGLVIVYHGPTWTIEQIMPTTGPTARRSSSIQLAIS